MAEPELCPIGVVVGIDAGAGTDVALLDVRAHAVGADTRTSERLIRQPNAIVSAVDVGAHARSLAEAIGDRQEPGEPTATSVALVCQIAGKAEGRRQVSSERAADAGHVRFVVPPACVACSHTGADGFTQ